MVLSEFEERVKEIIGEAVEGNLHPETLDFLNEVLEDYRRFEETGTDGKEWKEKYLDIKEKYISRFMNGEPEEITKEKKEVKEDVGKEDGKKEEFEKKQIKDIFEED